MIAVRLSVPVRFGSGSRSSGWLPTRPPARPPREEAERDCLSAITFALEGDPRDYDANAETVTFDVRVAPAA